MNRAQETSNLSKKAWKLREDGKPIPAIALWTQLISKYEAEDKWDEVVNTLIDISIAWKILGRQEKEPIYYKTALATLKCIRTISEKQNMPLRRDWDYYMGEVQIAAGKYKSAINSFNKFLKNPGLTPEEQANINTQIAFAKVKLGGKEGAINLLRESIDTLENPTREFVYQNKDVVAIWKTGAMLKLAQVLDDSVEAKKLAQKALNEAKQKGLGARVKQATGLLKEL